MESAQARGVACGGVRPFEFASRQSKSVFLHDKRHATQSRGYNPGNHPATAFRLANLGRRREEGGELNSDESQKLECFM